MHSKGAAAAAVVWSWPLGWAEGGILQSACRAQEGQIQPLWEQTWAKCLSPCLSTWPCQCWRQTSQETLQLTVDTRMICPVSHSPPACVLRRTRIWFPGCFLNGSQSEGVNHSTTVLQPNWHWADHSSPITCPWSKLAPSLCLLTSLRLGWGWCSPCLNAYLVRKPAEGNSKHPGAPNSSRFSLRDREW